jgi:ribose transport system substrate-binding protein
MMKKTLIVGLLITMLATLAACGGQTPSSSPTSSGKHYKIVYIPGIASDPYYIALNRGAQDEAKKEGATVQYSGSAQAFSPSTQLPYLNAAIAQKPDLIMIAPTDKVAMQAPIQRAISAGIPVVLVDTTLQDPSIAVTSIGFDNVTGGAQAADALAQILGSKGKVAIVSTTAGVSTGDDRVRGFTEEMKSKYPNITIVSTLYAGDDTVHVASAFKSVLTAHPDLAGAFTINGITGDGVTAAAREAGVEGKIKLVEYGSSSSQAQGVQNGTVTALIGPSPYTIGLDAVQYGIQYLNNKRDFAKHINTPQLIITKDNINDPKSALFLY